MAACLNINPLSARLASAILHGDCLDRLPEVPDGSVDLIITSPPYGNQRKETYGGIDPDESVDWFIPRAAEFYRVLKDTGSFILIIKEHVVNGERHTYVNDLVKALINQRWYWIDKFTWVKTNPIRGKWPNRLANASEDCYHFTLGGHFKTGLRW